MTTKQKNKLRIIKYLLWCIEEKGDFVSRFSHVDYKEVARELTLNVLNVMFLINELKSDGVVVFNHMYLRDYSTLRETKFKSYSIDLHNTKYMDGYPFKEYVE